MGFKDKETEFRAEDKTKDVFPASYKPILGFLETQRAISIAKRTFEELLCDSMNLLKVESPRFILTGTGIQDDLAGTQTPVAVDLASRPHHRVEIVHSLAKWKRSLLSRPEFCIGDGVLALMEAIRKDEAVSPIHSHFVDQWDWECVIGRGERTLDILKKTAKLIYSCLVGTQSVILRSFPLLQTSLPEEITFVHSEDLEAEFPSLKPSERELQIVKRHKAVFLIGIGAPLASGEPHDLRAVDYDDWITETGAETRGLNGDILVWDSLRNAPMELSSMGIRVDSVSLKRQMEIAGETSLEILPFHRDVIEERLPLTIGGGIGRSRVAMLLLGKAHIGEVQSSVWPMQTEEAFEKRGIPLL